ncbi:hypothetical protein AAFF_G00202930 [Aldrovandia affinis]|uniref:Uncharacterized protein n=1 Tax=Aldrovandia affinis TaxID=143900 RepID=A0AAD7SWY6_9TELE|nr:hypothetical protein AAFF_G00202930 [Aldrovandia affinis]
MGQEHQTEEAMPYILTTLCTLITLIPSQTLEGAERGRMRSETQGEMLLRRRDFWGKQALTGCMPASL